MNHDDVNCGLSNSASSQFLQFPKLHQDGIHNIFFSWPRILGWMINGVCSSLIIYYFTTGAIFHQAFRQDGHAAGSDILGVTMYTCVVWTVNCQLAIYLSYFTWIQHCHMGKHPSLVHFPSDLWFLPANDILKCIPRFSGSLRLKSSLLDDYSLSCYFCPTTVLFLLHHTRDVIPQVS